MIIDKSTKLWQQIYGKNYNYGGQNYYYVEDNTILANKVISLSPRFDFVLDENDNLIDVVEIPKTEEEIKQERIEEIKTELNDLDATINRATEDLYVLTETTPYKSIQEVIDRKEELRKELQNLTKVGE